MRSRRKLAETCNVNKKKNKKNTFVVWQGVPQCDRVGKVERVKNGKFTRRLEVGHRALQFLCVRVCERLCVWV